MDKFRYDAGGFNPGGFGAGRSRPGRRGVGRGDGDGPAADADTVPDFSGAAAQQTTYEDKYESLQDNAVKNEREDEEEDEEFADRLWSEGEQRREQQKKADPAAAPLRQERNCTFQFFDFRGGRAQWPKSAHIVSQERAKTLRKRHERDVMIRTAKKPAKKAAAGGGGLGGLGLFGGSGDDDDDGDDIAARQRVVAQSNYSTSQMRRENAKEDDTYDEEENPQELTPPREDMFERMADGSYCFRVPAGHRIMLDLRGLRPKAGRTAQNDDAFAPNRKGRNKARAGRAKAAGTKAAAAAVAARTGGAAAGAAGAAGAKANRAATYYANAHLYRDPTTYVEYTITMDVRLDGLAPGEDSALFQTSLSRPVEGEASAAGTTRGGVTFEPSNGECTVAPNGGVGTLGSFGDVTRHRLRTGRWVRLTICVEAKGAGPGKVKAGDKEPMRGRMRTWLNGFPLADVIGEEIDGPTYGLRDVSLFLFSAGDPARMRGSFSIRTLRVETAIFQNTEQVRRFLTEDRLLDRFNEDSEKKVDELRGRLSLAEHLPRGAAPHLVRAAGHGAPRRAGGARVPLLETSGSHGFIWEHRVFMLCIDKVLADGDSVLGDLAYQARVSASDALLVLQGSAPLFGTYSRLVRFGSEPGLPAPLYPHAREEGAHAGARAVHARALLRQRRHHRPDPPPHHAAALPRHAALHRRVRGAVLPRVPRRGRGCRILYKTALVLDGVPRRNVLDSTFWTALYLFGGNLRPQQVPDSTALRLQLYEILVPFLTGKPLDESLLDAADVASWKPPTVGITPLSTCLLEALHFLMREASAAEAECAHAAFALRLQMAKFLRHDLTCLRPNASGVRTAEAMARGLGRHAAQVAELYEALGSDAADATAAMGAVGAAGDAAAGAVDEAGAGAEVPSPSTATTDSMGEREDGSFDAPWPHHALLSTAHAVANELESVVAEVRRMEDEPPPLLDLSEENSVTQCRDSLCWSLPLNFPTPGGMKALRRYVPVDFLQIPERATTFDEAVHAMRLCDRLCMLIDHQGHCIKNTKLLIFALIEHTFIHVLPVPKPREAKPERRGRAQSTPTSARAATASAASLSSAREEAGGGAEAPHRGVEGQGSREEGPRAGTARGGGAGAQGRRRASAGSGGRRRERRLTTAPRPRRTRSTVRTRTTTTWLRRRRPTCPPASACSSTLRRWTASGTTAPSPTPSRWSTCSA